MNLMSTFLAVFTLWLIYSLIFKMTSSRVSAFVGAFVLAFIPVFWFQTVSAEVYTLHTFFVALLIRLLWWWDERREFYALLLFVFVTGISFGNHLQTVMLAPAVLFIVISADKKLLFNVKNFALLSVFFVVALSLYLYLPIRTEAGAAIHWGDPNDWERFLAHVTGSSHREGYVLKRAPLEYFQRTNETLWLVVSQFGVMLILALWGWLKLASRRWRIFFGLVVIFDLIYTVFLNTVSLKVTAFTLPSAVVVGILMGVGIAHILTALKGLKGVGGGARRLIKAAFCMAPAVALILNYGLCDQSRNYTGYEQATNIFRTLGTGDILFVHGDNYVFPVAYGRVAERMREDVQIYDRLNILFKMPNLDTYSLPKGNSWEDERDRVEQGIVKAREHRGVFYAVFGPQAIKVPDDHQLVPYGLLHRVAGRGDKIKPSQIGSLWKNYSTESFEVDFEKDFMNREVSAYFSFRRGVHLILSGQREVGLRNMRLASHIGYDDTLIHSDMAVFLTDHGLFEEAREELEKALIYHEDLSGVHNNWGYYYHKIGRYKDAATSFRKAVELRPDNIGYHNNLGFALYEVGKNEEAFHAFKKSLSMNENQPEIKEFVAKYGLKEGIGQ